MRHRLRPPVATFLLLLTIAVFFYVLTQLSLFTQRVEVSSWPDNLLVKSGIPLQRSESGATTQNPSYFWGQLRVLENEPARLPNNLAAKSGNPVSETSGRTAATEDALPTAPSASRPGPTWYDPRISVDEAMSQVSRISRERRLDEVQVIRLVRQYTEGTWFGLLGEPQVNVRDLNQALDRLAGG